MTKKCAVCGKTTRFLNENDECAQCELDAWELADEVEMNRRHKDDEKQSA